MPLQLQPNTSEPFRLKAHANVDDAPVFHIRPLTGRTVLEIGGVDNVGLSMFASVAAAVTGIDNLLDVTGEPADTGPQKPQRVGTVTIPAGAVSVDLLGRLPEEWLAELANEVSRRTKVTPEDVGKSS